MMDFHIIYTKKDGSIVAEDHEFKDFAAVEKWLESIGATYWEIGIDDENLDKILEKMWEPKC